MIRFAWRQFRTQAFVVAGILVALGIALALDGSHLAHLYDTTVATCKQHNDCGPVTQNFEARANWNHVLDALMLVAPALIGGFWGAPLVARELETRTNQLAWTQSVTRSNWFLVKTAVVGMASVITVGLLSLMVTWWAAPYDRLIDSPYSVFDQRDVAPIAYAVFAFALGVTSGTIIRRTLPAMALTVTLFAVIRVEVGEWIRPRLFAPLHATGVFALPTPNSIFVAPGGVRSSDWLISEEVVTSSGRVIGQNGGIGPAGSINFSSSPNGTVRFNGVGICPNKFPAFRTSGSPSDLRAATQRCVESFHLHTVVTYLPASRYWALQWSESGIFVIGAGMLLALSLLWVRKRIA
jgi:hypothetical protein